MYLRMVSLVDINNYRTSQEKVDIKLYFPKVHNIGGRYKNEIHGEVCHIFLHITNYAN